MCEEAAMNTAKNNESSPRAAKRARFAGMKERSSGPSPWVLIAGLLVVVAIIGGVAFALTRPTSTNAEAPAALSTTELDTYRSGSQGLLVAAATHGHDPYPLVVADGDAVRMPLATFDDYQAHYYTYMHEGRPIEFFVLKSKDGVVRVAFNACDVCYLSKKGYTQDGDYVVCNNCGQRFPANEINDIHGGCNPSPLERQVDGDNLVIRVEDLVAGKVYF
jgi:hypothetical protein